MSDVTPPPSTVASEMPHATDAPVALLDPPEPIDARQTGPAPDSSSTVPGWPGGNRRPGPVSRFFRGKESDAPWVRPALLVLLAATAVLYIWDLGASGWANSFYSAAVQAGTKSWKAFFFGSSDSSNFITVDKPPVFLWPMEISARIFGLNSWSLLVPQALEGVATVGLVYLSVRRWFSARAALLGGAVVALTPVAAMMFRYNNPDALLALLLTAATYATMRGLERAQTKWLVLAGALVGFGFITKMMQAFLVLPVFAVVYLLAAPTGWWRRVWQVFLMGVSVLVAAGWWVAAVALTPAADRPYVGGSQNNSILNLIFGYNGFGRLSGNESGSVGGGGFGGRGGGSMWGPTGLTRLFNSDFGNMMSWLLPGALVMGAVLLLITIRNRRTDRERAALLLVGRIARGHRAHHQPGPGHHPPLLHGRHGAAARGARRHRDDRPVGATRSLARSSRPRRRPGRDGVVERRALGRTSDWFPALRPFVAVGGSARRRGDPRPPAVALRAEAGDRARLGAGAQRRPGRAAVLDRGHRGHPAPGRHPLGHPDAGRRVRRSRWRFRRWRFPPGLRWRRRRAVRWQHRDRRWHSARWLPRRRRVPGLGGAAPAPAAAPPHRSAGAPPHPSAAASAVPSVAPVAGREGS